MWYSKWTEKGGVSMIKVSCRTDIMDLFVKSLGSGEESIVGLLKDGRHVAKCFHQPRDLKESNNLLMGKDLNQTSFCFLKDLVLTPHTALHNLFNALFNATSIILSPILYDVLQSFTKFKDYCT